MENKINFDEVDFEKMDVVDFGKLACIFGDSKEFHNNDSNAKLYAFEANMEFRYKSRKTKDHDEFFKFINHINNIMDPCGVCYEKPGNFIDLDDVECKLFTRASNPDYVWHVGYDSMSNYKKFIKSKPMKLFKNINLLQLDVFAWVDKKRSHITMYAYTMSDDDFEKLRNDMKNNETLNTLYSKGFRLH